MNVKFISATSENIAALQKHMAYTLDNDHEPEPEPVVNDSPSGHQPMAEKPYNPIIRINVK